MAFPSLLQSASSGIGRRHFTVLYPAMLCVRQNSRGSLSAGRSRCRSVVQATAESAGSEMLEVPEPEDARGAIAVRHICSPFA